MVNGAPCGLCLASLESVGASGAPTITVTGHLDCLATGGGLIPA